MTHWSPQGKVVSDTCSPRCQVCTAQEWTKPACSLSIWAPTVTAVSVGRPGADSKRSHGPSKQNIDGFQSEEVVLELPNVRWVGSSFNGVRELGVRLGFADKLKARPEVRMSGRWIGLQGLLSLAQRLAERGVGGEGCVEVLHEAAGHAGVDVPLRGEDVRGAGSHHDACKGGNVYSGFFPFAERVARREHRETGVRKRVPAESLKTGFSASAGVTEDASSRPWPT